MYRLLRSGEIGAPWGVPFFSSLFRVVLRLLPRLSVSSTGATSHDLIRCSICLSLTRRLTDFINSLCGIVSKYPLKSASIISVCPVLISECTRRIASWALFPGRYANCSDPRSASKIGSSTSTTAICTTRSLIVGTVSAKCTAEQTGFGMGYYHPSVSSIS